MEKLYQFLLTVCNSPKFFKNASNEKDPESDDNRISILVSNLGKIIRMFYYLCKYSSDLCLAAITEMNILEIIETLLKREQSREKSATSVLSETLSLLGALIPDSRSYKNDDSDYANNEKAKSTVFEENEGDQNNYRKTLIQSILPSMLKLFVSSFNQNVKFTFLQLTEEIVMMLSGETLREHMHPYLFSRFVITTMKSDNYSWIETCLRIMQILTDKKVTSCNLALHREGIQEYLSVFADKDKFKELTGIQINDEEEEKKQEDIGDIFGDEPNPNFAVPPQYQQNEIIPEAPKELEKEDSKALDQQEKVVEEAKLEVNSTEAKEDDKPINDDGAKVEGNDKEEEKVQVKPEEGYKTPEKPKEEQALVSEVQKQSEPQLAEKPNDNIPSEKEEQSKESESIKKDEEPREEEKHDSQSLFKDFSNPSEGPKIESSSMQQPSNISLSQQVSDLQEQKAYLDDLKSAIKESISEISELSKEFEEAMIDDISKEELALKKEQQEEQLDPSNDKKLLSKRKIKKLFIKKAIQNLDENLVGIEEIEGFEEAEIQKIRDIIAKKKLLQRGKAAYNQEARKYSRDFIGINTAPMYKNIVSISKKLLVSFEESLKEEFDKDANVLSRLTKLAEEMTQESKSARKFDKEKTVEIFKRLIRFFEGDSNSTKITQYELCKSKLVHALHSYLSLPLKEEESKSNTKSQDLSPQKYEEEYMTILSRYVCLVDTFMDCSSTRPLKALVSLLENSLKISFTNFFSQELTAYHDGVNLGKYMRSSSAYDLKKYSKRNKLQIVYDPNVEEKFRQEEAIERGEIPNPNVSVKQFFKAKGLIKEPKKDYEGEGFEDQDLFKSITEPKMDKTISTREVKKEPLIEGIFNNFGVGNKNTVEAPIEEVKSQASVASDLSVTFLKRDALYKELKSVNVSVENSSTIEVIKDFLRNKVNTKENVKQLKSHSGLGSISSQIQHIFDKTRRYIDKANARGDNLKDLSSVIARMVNDTFNEPENADKLNENDKLLLIKDIETLLGKSASATTVITQANQSLASEDKPKVEVQNPVVENAEKGKEVEEEEKKVESEPTSQDQHKESSLIKELPRISETSSFNPPAEIKGLKDDEEEEEQIEYGSKGKQKWDFFGKLKKFFFTSKSQKDEDLEGEEEEDEDSEEQLHEQLLQKAIEESALEAKQQEEKQKEEDKEEEKEERQQKKPKDKKVKKEKKEENKFIDAPLELKDIDEEEDVVFEFFYNRTKISPSRTLYELINYQPTHRSISDPNIIYFKIADRKPLVSANPSEVSSTAETNTIKKEKELIATISQN